MEGEERLLNTAATTCQVRPSGGGGDDDDDEGNRRTTSTTTTEFPNNGDRTRRSKTTASFSRHHRHRNSLFLLICILLLFWHTRHAEAYRRGRHREHLPLDDGDQAGRGLVSHEKTKASGEWLSESFRFARQIVHVYLETPFFSFVFYEITPNKSLSAFVRPSVGMEINHKLLPSPITFIRYLRWANQKLRSVELSVDFMRGVHVHDLCISYR